MSALRRLRWLWNLNQNGGNNNSIGDNKGITLAGIGATQNGVQNKSKKHQQMESPPSISYDLPEIVLVVKLVNKLVHRSFGTETLALGNYLVFTVELLPHDFKHRYTPFCFPLFWVYNTTKTIESQANNMISDKMKHTTETQGVFQSFYERCPVNV